MIWDHSECLPRFTQVLFFFASNYCIWAKRGRFDFFFYVIDSFSHVSLASFCFFPWLLSISTKYTPIRSVILALHILSSSSSWVSSSSAAGLHKLVNSERTTLFSSKHMRLLGIMWCMCRSVCMYVGKIELKISNESQERELLRCFLLSVLRIGTKQLLLVYFSLFFASE